MTYRVRNIAIAVALAVLAAMLTSFYVNQQKERLQGEQEPTTVFVATEDIPIGTPGSQAVDMLDEEQVAKEAVAPGAIVKPEDIEGKVATEKVYAGEQVTALRFGTQAEQGVRAQLEGTLRAIQVPGEPHQLLAGTLKAGDRVDLVTLVKFEFFDPRTRKYEENVATRVVLRDLLVLRGAQSPTGSVKVGDGGGENLTVLLAVTDSQSQKLLYATENSEAWSLDLRPTKDPADSPESLETVGSLLTDGLGADQLQQLRGRRIK